MFELQSEWIGAEFEIKWEEAPRSRPVNTVEQGIFYGYFHTFYRFFSYILRFILILIQ